MKNENVEKIAKDFMDKEIFPDHGGELLSKILERFGRDGMEFTCESEFQFELAWAMRQVFEKLGLNDYKIIFEALTKHDDNVKKAKKDYIDLAIQYGNSAVLIELKYKKAAQSAQSWNSYLFLEDVERLEYYVGRTISDGKLANAKIERGYAILLTDSHYYYEKCRDRKKWGQFSVYKGLTINGTLTVNGSDEYHRPLEIKGEYVCEWQPYRDNEKYLLFEVNDCNK